MLLACADGGLCVLAAIAVATGVSTLLVKLGLKKAPCDPHCPKKSKPPRKWKSSRIQCPNCGGMELTDDNCCVGCGEA